MSYSSTATRGSSRKRASIQDVHHYYKKLETHLNNSHHNNDTCTYINRQLRHDIKFYLLSFEPESHQYQQFTDLYLKCSKLIIQFLHKYPHNYYQPLLFCLTALLGFASEQYQCFIFAHIHHSHSNNAQSSNLHSHKHVRYAHKINDCQLSVIDLFFSHIHFFIHQINHNKLGLFNLSAVLFILYHIAKYASQDAFANYYGNHGAKIQSLVRDYVHNLDIHGMDEAVNYNQNSDDLTYFTNLFTLLSDLFQEFIYKPNRDNSLQKQLLLSIKLEFCLKLLTCNKKARRVQSLSLIKIIFEAARCEDNKYKNNNEWSTKGKHQSQNRANQNANTLRQKCAEFIIHKKIIHLLMSPSYIHYEYLTRLAPIIDVLCECNQLSIEIIKVLWHASGQCNSVELKQFNQIYLSLTKRINDVSLLSQFYHHINLRYNHKDIFINESHLEFISQFTCNFTDKNQKNNQNSKNWRFAGLQFLKNYAIDFQQEICINLRKIAFEKMYHILAKQAQKCNIVTFLNETFKNIEKCIARNTKESNCIDLTYVILGIDKLLCIKHVGKTNDKLYQQIAEAVYQHNTKRNKHKPTIIDLMVNEIAYWYWHCPTVTPDGHNRSKSRKKKELKLRFDFIKTLALKTPYVIQDHHVNLLRDIPHSQTPKNAASHQKIRDVLSQQLNVWLNDCVKLNSDSNNTLLDREAIRSIFLKSFREKMDISAFNSWLAYFHDLNGNNYDLNCQKYHHIHNLGAIVGIDKMWQVIEHSTDYTVIIAMMDELIKLYHAHGTYTYVHGDDGSHVPFSDGINDLFEKCDQQFAAYNYHKNDVEQEYKTMRYLLLLRRIMEYSIGIKATVYNNSNRLISQKINLKIVYRKKAANARYNNRDNSGKYPFELELNAVCLNKPILEIRGVIAQKLRKENARFVQLYRKAGSDGFVLMEEHTLPYLTCNDLISDITLKPKTKVIELEYIVLNNNSNRYDRHNRSFASKYCEYGKFVNLQYLLSSGFAPVALSAHQVLRYLAINGKYRDELIRGCYNHTQKYFDSQKPIMNIYNIDMLRYYADMKCITKEEQQRSDKIIFHIYNKNVFDVLFNVFINQVQLSGHNNMYRILRIKQFNRLCHMFHEVKMPHFDSQSHGHGAAAQKEHFRVISNYTNKSNEIMLSLMSALEIALNCDVTQHINLFDMTSPKQMEALLVQTISKCFTLAVYLILNKPRNFATPKKAVDEKLQHIFLNGLKHLNNLKRVVFNTRNNKSIRRTLYNGLRQFIQNNAKYIDNILSILIKLIPKSVSDVNAARHCSGFFKLITDLIIGSNRQSNAQKYIASVLKYVFNKLADIAATTSHKRPDSKEISSLLQCANRLYPMYNPNNELTLAPRGDITLLLDKCLFGSTHQDILLCPSHTEETRKTRQQAFALLFSILEVYKDANLLNILVESLHKHLDITSQHIDDDDVDGYDNEMDEKENIRKDFVGLLNLGATCYLNSILQQLFMVPSFTNEILSVANNNNIVYELQRVLLSLRESHKKYLNATDFCKCVKNSDGNAIDFYEQTDCQESLVSLFQQLESSNNNSQTHGNGIRNILYEHFGCKLRYLTKCNRGHIFKRDEDHLGGLALAVKDSPNLLDSLSKFTEGEILDGDNKYLCEECNGKVSAIRRQTIYMPPKQLILCLKRFEWNFDTGNRQKLNTKFEFQPVLNLKKYLNTNFEDVDEDKKDDEAEDEEAYIYDLVGIVIHQGSANTGHYYDYIKDRDAIKDEWFRFDDKKVFKTDFNELQKEAFGGPVVLGKQAQIKTNNNSQSNPWNKQTNKQNKGKGSDDSLLSKRNAYILFYEQRSVKSQHNKKSTEKKQQYPEYLNAELAKITNENIKIFRKQILYDEYFIHFMKNLYFSKSGIITMPLAANKMNKINKIDSVLIRFIFNIVPIKMFETKEINECFDLLKNAFCDFNENQLKDFMKSKLLPSYLMNIFGKYKNRNYRLIALRFFEFIARQKINHNPELLHNLLQSLIFVISKWNSIKITCSKMEEIIDLINIISELNMDIIESQRERIMESLVNLIKNDFEWAQWVQTNSNSPDLCKSDSNLNIEKICKLLLKLININPSITKRKILNDKMFCRQLIAKNYNKAQVRIICGIVEKNTMRNNVDTFKVIVKSIHGRMELLDFHEIYAALQIFNALFEDYNDEFIEEKLQTQCLRQHLDKIVANRKFWCLTQISIQLLAELCKKNILIRAWIQENCFSQLEIIQKWCQKNNRFKPGNQNNRKNYANYSNNAVRLYRYKPYFDDKNKQQKLKEWKRRIDIKMSEISKKSPMDCWKEINKKD